MIYFIKVPIGIFVVALATWNEFLLASILIRDLARQPITAGLMTFIGERGTDFGLLSAGVLINVAPVLLVYIFLLLKI